MFMQFGTFDVNTILKRIKCTLRFAQPEEFQVKKFAPKYSLLHEQLNPGSPREYLAPKVRVVIDWLRRQAAIGFWKELKLGNASAQVLDAQPPGAKNLVSERKYPSELQVKLFFQ